MKITLLTKASGKTNDNKPTKYHIFDDNDTYCTMYSTGGLKYEITILEVTQEHYKLLDANKEICRMCSNTMKHDIAAEKSWKKADLGHAKMMSERYKMLLEEEKQLDRIDKAECDARSGGY